MFRTALFASIISLGLCAQQSPAEQSPPLPDAIIDLRTETGAELVHGQWRFAEASIIEVEPHVPGQDGRPAEAGKRTHDITPHAGARGFDDSSWPTIAADSLEERRTGGRLAMGWYRVVITLPSRVGETDLAGATVVLELVADDYAEVWLDGAIPQVLGTSGGQLVSGWNAPNRVVLTEAAQPGQRFEVAILVANAPLSDPPPNFVWIRSATLDVYKPGRLDPAQPVNCQFTRVDPAFDQLVPAGALVQRLASGFSFIEGPVWVPLASDNRYGGGGRGGYLLFSDPNRNVIHRWDPTGRVSIFRTKSGYTGVDIGAYHQPGSNGLALDPAGRLTICEHGNRRVTRLEPNGAITVLADRFEGKKLNSPNDLVYRSDGALYFTDPPFGLPGVFDDKDKQLPFSGVYCLHQGRLRLVSRDLAGPNGLAFSPDEKYLYVDNWDEHRKVILRYNVAADGGLSDGQVFFDLTQRAPGEIALDGLKVDPSGNLFVSGPGGIWVLSPDARHMGTISPPELPANFAFGGEDGRTLFMAARTGLYRMWLGRSESTR